MFQENAAGSVHAFSTSMFQSCGNVTVCVQSNQRSEHKRCIKWRSECGEGGLNTYVLTGAPVTQIRRFRKIDEWIMCL